MVQKNTTGGNGGSFTFTSANVSLNNFFGPSNPLIIAGFNGSTFRIAPDLVPGSNYNIIENPQSGWNLSGASCDNGTLSNIVVVAGQTTTCTFSNTSTSSGTGSIKVVKKTVGNNGIFSFNASINLGLISIGTTGTSAGGSGFWNISGLIPGAKYSISEIVPSGWDLTSSSCTNGTTSSINVVANQETVCTFNNTYNKNSSTKGSIKIVKNITSGVDRTFGFTNNFGVTSFRTVNRTGFQTVSGLDPGSNYSISELVPNNWTLTSSSCTNGTINNIIVNAGQTTTCTFTNKYNAPGFIKIAKKTTGGNGTFSFISSFGVKSLTTSSGTASKTVSGLIPSGQGINYDIEEIPKTNWTLTSVSCNNGTIDNIIVVSGQTTTCTFSNKYSPPPPTTGSIKIVKNATGGNSKFDFFSNFGVNTLTTISGTASKTITGLAPGSNYNIKETVPANWDLTSSSCDRGTPDAIEVVAGQITSCTFNNKLSSNGSIKIIKKTTDGDGTFSFTSNFGVNSLTTSSGTGIEIIFNLTPGSGYNIKETVPSNWTLTSSSCDNGSLITAIKVVAGKTTSCTFNNKYTAPPPTTGSIKVVKKTTGGNGSYKKFDYNSNFGINSLTTDGFGTAEKTISNLATGSNYNILELLPDNWTLVGEFCDSGTPNDSSDDTVPSDDNKIIVVVGQTTTCTFTNKYTPPPTLRLKKSVSGGTAAPYNWQLTATSSSGTFTDGGNSLIFHSVTAGIPYTLTESSVNNYYAGSWSCDGGSLSLNIITLIAGQKVTCTITNTYAIDSNSPKLTIKKIIDNTAGGTTSASSAFAPYQAGTNTLKLDTPTPLVPGTYTITEKTVANYNASYSGACQGGSVVLKNGDNIICTITNTYSPNSSTKGSIKVVKKIADGNNSVFSFQSSSNLGFISLSTINGTAQKTVPNLTPSSGLIKYFIKETAPTGWVLTSQVCDSGTPNDSSDDSVPSDKITVIAGQTTSCTFINTYAPLADRGSIKLVKNTVGGDAKFYFNSSNPGFVSLTTSGGTASYLFPNRYPGTNYNFSEAIPPTNWILTSSSCDRGTPNAIEVVAGQITTCTFTNTYSPPLPTKGSIKIVKNTTGGDTTFSFNASSNLGTYIFLTTTGGTAEKIKPDLTPGSNYSISENVTSGWTLTGASCSNGNPANITVVAGQETVCIFNNEKPTKGSIKIVKNTTGGNGSFSFTSNFGVNSITTSSGMGFEIKSNLTPGSGYNIQETIPSDWSLAGASCDSGSLITAIKVVAGKTTSCTFNNTYTPPPPTKGSIKIVKNTTGGDGTFIFNSNFGVGSLTTSNGTIEKIIPDLTPGSNYNISENSNSEWTLTGSSCNNGTPANITVVAGQETMCTFNNEYTPTGSIKIIKNTTGGDGSFSFTNSSNLGMNSLTTDNGTAERIITKLIPGSNYYIEESVPIDWTLDLVTCSESSELKTNGVKNIKVLAGKETICTFSNTYSPPPTTGSIKIIKETKGEDDKFDFESSFV